MKNAGHFSENRNKHAISIASKEEVKIKHKWS